MSSRPILSPYSVITNASMSASVTSLVTVIQTNSMISYDISWTGTPTGTFSVQVSDTYQQNAAGVVSVPGNWSTLPLSSTPTLTGSAGNGAIDIDASGFYAIRLVYNYTSGTGVLNATVSGKVA